MIRSLTNDTRPGPIDDLQSRRGTMRPAAEVEQWDGGSISLQRYVATLTKHRLLILGTTIAAALLALIVTMLTEPRYVARTTFEVQREAPRVLDVNSAESDSRPSDSMFMETQLAFIRSRAMAEGIVKRLHLDQNDAFVDDAATGGGDGKAPAVRQRRIDAATAVVMRNIEAAPLVGSSVIELRYTSNDARLSAAIANAAVDQFIESTTQRQYAASSYARSFVGNRLTQQRARLEESERQLVAYAEQNGIISVTDAKTAGTGSGAQSLDSASMAALNDRVAAARANRILAEQAWNLARSPRADSLPEVRDNVQIAALTGQLATLEADYQQKRQTYKPGYAPMEALAAQIASVRGQIATLRGRIVGGFRAAYELALNQERALQVQLDQLKGSVSDLQTRSIQYMILQREVDTNRALYDALLQRFKEIGVAGGSGANNVSVIDTARAPGAPASPILWLNLLLAIGFGVLAGVGIAFIIEFVDDSIKMPDDVEQKLHLPLLGITPTVEGAEIPALLANKRSSLSEAYYSIQTALQLATPGGLPRTLLVTSAAMAEGKSTTSAALAQGVADRGKRVLLVDADLRKPTLHHRFAQTNQVGFSNLLTGELPLSDVRIRLQDQGFDIITSGPLPPNPALLLSSGLQSQIDALMADYDLVILDGPPVMGLADAPLLADVAEATVLVIEARRSRRGAIRSALRRLGDARGMLAGVVLTKFSSRDAGYGGYYYSSYYSYGQPSS